jgi:BirA family biotin operon repressor/biotin-[acetyl-CoA-carboxylase] ligase
LTAFVERLRTRRLGRMVVVRATAESTNDLAWEGMAQGLPDGAVFVADEQTRGRGREGRRWIAPAGAGLLMSVALRLGCEPRPLGLLPLAAGLAAAAALRGSGVAARLKWPNDVLIGSRKLAGLLCEARPLDPGDRAAVVGLGVNVSQVEADFAPELRGRAVSLRMAGSPLGREEVAAAFLNALEPLLDDYAEGGGSERLRARYREAADFWGQPVTVRAAGGEITGVARDLDAAGGLVVRLESGREVVAVAGDLELGAMEEPR